MIVRVAFVALLTLYPFAVYFGIRVLPASFFGILLALLIALRFVFTRPDDRKMLMPALLLLLAYAVGAAISGRTQALLYYPALVNLLLCVFFLASLRGEEPILLRIVRTRGVKTSKYAPAYLRRLTAIWAGFFALNALLSLWTTTQSLEIWTLYNGLVAYLLVAVLFVVEYFFRRHYKKRMNVGT